VFSPSRTNPAERIYALKREVLELHDAVAPLADPLDALARGRHELVHEEVRPYYRDVHDTCSTSSRTCRASATS
jgi:magnesium transporter